MGVKMTKEQAREIAKKSIESSKKRGFPVKRKEKYN